MLSVSPQFLRPYPAFMQAAPPFRIDENDADDREAIRRGAALAWLREQAGLSQEAAALKAGFRTQQSWQRYEAGAAGIFKPATLRKLLTAVGATEEGFGLALASLAEPSAQRPSSVAGFADRERRTYEVILDGTAKAGGTGPAFNDLPGPARFKDLSWLFDEDTRYLEAQGESMTGYVEPGQVVAYHLTRWPRRGDGCVIELKTGERLIKEYVKSDTSFIYASQRFPEDDLKWPRGDVLGVYKIMGRLD